MAVQLDGKLALDAEVKGACPHDCPDTCAFVSTVASGRVVKVSGSKDHPSTAGVLCTKVSRYAERTYSADRLKTPMRRIGPKGSGRFVPISWDEALDEIAIKLKSIAARDPEAILPYNYAGTMGYVQGGEKKVRFYPLSNPADSAGIPANGETERFFAATDRGDFLLVQNRVFRKVFWGYPFFFE